MILSACLPTPPGTPAQQEKTATPTITGQTAPTRTPPLLHPPTPERTSSPIPTEPANLPPSVWVNPYLPQEFIANLHLPEEWDEAEYSAALIHIDVGTSNPISTWVYALVAPFPTIADSVSSSDLSQFWLEGHSEGIEINHLLVDQGTRNILEHLWGAPSPDIILTLPADMINEHALNNSSDWAIIPFEQIIPKWKVIEIDGISPLRKTFDPSDYPLNVPISVSSPPSQSIDFSSLIESSDLSQIAPPSNRDPGKMTTVILTGVTALVRATAAMMEQRGLKYPGEDIREWLVEADLTHINNEVPFARDCPAPQFQRDDLVFCSRTKYIELLEDIGTDIVELCGDHFSDWGPEAMLYTLDLYKERGWLFYGGGANLEEGQKALLIEHNGNLIAFIGCNAKPKAYAQASDTQPGAVHCDYTWLHAEIRRLRQNGYVPIVTFQHEEIYTYEAPPTLQTDFRAAAEAGAAVVSGSQAHQPQAIEFTGDSFIHYGLGNLFFDQYYLGLHTRQAFIDRHIIYDGQHISTELLTIMFIDYARPRPMTAEERHNLLEVIFKASNFDSPAE